MNSLAENGVTFSSLIAYGILIFLYLVILRLLLNMLQQMSDQHVLQKSVIDRDIHKTMTNRVETSMHAFDIYSVAIVIAKGGIATLAMAAIIVLLIVKVGLLATIFLIAIVILLLYGYNRWARSREKAESLRGEIRKNIQKAGSGGMILLLSIALVVLLFVMISLGV
jgi:uncharacterized membrane protein YidH (DUF202 family)